MILGTCFDFGIHSLVARLLYQFHSLRQSQATAVLFAIVVVFVFVVVFNGIFL